VVKILLENQNLIETKLGASIEIRGVADLDINTPRDVEINPDLLTTDADMIIRDPKISLIVELIGGYEPARSFILKALEEKKHVVTANKALLAKHGQEIFNVAYQNKVYIGFEASVAGGIPIIHIIREGLVANEINYIYGILNGTTNYILSKMTDERRSFKETLKEAQKLGYAEADPTMDIEGWDSAHKLAILLSLAYGIEINFEKIFVEGISKITPLDIEFAKELGYKIKLLSISKKTGDEIEARVHPTLVPYEHLISQVNGTYNAIFINGNNIGSNLYYGKGAGMLPTGSAVASDIIGIARCIKMGIKECVPYMAFQNEYLKPGIFKEIKKLKCHYYMRFYAYDKPGVLSQISGILGNHDISIYSVVQKGRKLDGIVPIFMLTHEALEENVLKALKEINELSVTKDKGMLIRIEDIMYLE
jgi:homoserine dehydrogenase